MDTFSLSDKSFLINYLRQNNIMLRKSHGQNFAIDKNLINAMVQKAGINQNDVVLEIGPGIGTLTERLLQAGASVICVEIDTKLSALLRHHFGQYANFNLIEGDFLKKNIFEDVEKLIIGQSEGKKLKVAANLPYYITSPILTALFESKIPFNKVVLTIQKEVAQRLCSKKGTKDYSAITVFTNYYSKPEIVDVFPPTSFFPTPKVSSAVISLTPYDKKPYECQHPLFFHHFVKLCFTERRKMLKNSILKVLKGMKADLTNSEIDNILDSLNIPKDVRPEVLSVEEFIKISDKLQPLCPVEIKNKYI